MDANAISSGEKAGKPIIYNGTNADDQLDPTRLGMHFFLDTATTIVLISSRTFAMFVGLVAAAEFEVVSPLSHLTKSEVREVWLSNMTSYCHVIFMKHLCRLQSTWGCQTGIMQHLRV
jgi:hypothetical protein